MAYSRTVIAPSASLAASIRSAREGLGINQSEAAKKCGLSKSAYSSLELGNRGVTKNAAKRLGKIGWTEPSANGAPDRRTALNPINARPVTLIAVDADGQFLQSCPIPASEAEKVLEVVRVLSESSSK